MLICLRARTCPVLRLEKFWASRDEVVTLSRAVPINLVVRLLLN